MFKCSRCGSGYVSLLSKHTFFDIYGCDSCQYRRLIPIEDTCCRNPNTVVSIDRKNEDRLRLHMQCLSCGGCTDRSRPLKFSVYEKQIRNEFSHTRFEEWKVEISRESKILWDGVKQINFATSNYGKYTAYLSSEEWISKRKQALERDKGICRHCNLLEAREVHHLTYENLYDEKLEDLLSLCIECHANIHKK